jgi:tRNA(Arg) A34 adenosine deaminase TadA
MDDEACIRRALTLAEENLASGGGPFGAVIVKEGKIIAEGVNRVTAANDPTAHAEVIAIRNASAFLGTFDLSGCTIYTSCEPCPMCLGAIYWARLDAVFYSGSREDAGNAGFDDKHIYEEFEKEPGKRELPMHRILPGKAKGVFRKWIDMENKTSY